MSIARTAIWLSVGRLIVAATAVVIPPILARKLSPSDFGIYKQIDLAATLFMPFLILGFDKSLTYFVPRRERDPVDEITAPMLVIIGASVVAILFAIAFPGVFATLFGIASGSLLVITAATYAIASAVATMVARALIAVGSPGLASILPPAIGVPRTVVLLGVALFYPTLDAVIIALLVFAVVQAAVWLLVLIRKRLLRPRLRVDVLMHHLRYGSILAVAALAQTWGGRLDRYLVSSTLSPSVFAVFANGSTRVPFLPILAHALRDATAPRYSQLESEGRHREMAVLWRTGVDTMLPVGILASVFLCVTAHWTIPLYYGPNYLDSVPIFRVFAFSILAQSLVGVEQVLRALSALRFLFLSVLAALAIRIAGGLFALKYGSLVDLVAVQLVITMAVLLVRVAYIRRRLEVPWSVLTPTRSVRISLPLAAVGVLATLGIDRALGHTPLLALLAAGAVWGILGLAALWRQGTLQLLLSKLPIGPWRRSVDS